MILAIAALLLQIPTIPQNSISTVAKTAATVTRVAVLDASAKTGAGAATVSSHDSEAAEPALTSGARASEESSSASNLHTEGAAGAPVSLSLSAPVPRSKSELEDRSEKRRRREWLALSVAQHSAAMFDAWSTRQAISSGRAQELNPMLRPFVRNDSIYAAIQVGPVLFDYLGRRMMTSRHGWARRTWWILQAVSTATSLASGAHNLSVH
jgi:hypothetical protein